MIIVDSLLCNFLYAADDVEAGDCDDELLLLATAVSVDEEAEFCGRSTVVLLTS